jgi:hypothetical protein
MGLVKSLQPARQASSACVALESQGAGQHSSTHVNTFVSDPQGCASLGGRAFIAPHPYPSPMLSTAVSAQTIRWCSPASRDSMYRTFKKVHF